MCEQMHMFSDIYELTFENAADGLSMSFRKNAYLVERKTFDVR